MSGDFTAYSFEQFAGILDGVVLAGKLSKAILENKTVMFPLLILILIYGFFWWSLRIKDLKDLAKFFAWIVVVTVLLTYVSLPWNVRVYFNPSYAYGTNVEGSEFKILELKPVTKEVTSSSAVLIFSFPDKIADFFYEFIVGKLKFSSTDTTPTIEVGKCINPDSVYAEGLMRGFKKYLGSSVGNFKEVNELVETVKECTWELGESIKYDPVGSLVYALGRKIRGVEAKCKDFVKTLVDSINEVIDECKRVMGDKFDDKVYRKGVKLCVERKIGTCREMFSRFVKTAEKLDKVVWESPLKGIKTFPIAQDEVQTGVAWTANKASEFYLSYLTKWLVTLKVNGTLLGFLIGFSPLIILLSIIPIGNSSVNLKLLVGSMFVYFLLKLWIPVLYLVHYFAYHTLGFSAL